MASYHPGFSALVAGLTALAALTACTSGATPRGEGAEPSAPATSPSATGSPSPSSEPDPGARVRRPNLLVIETDDMRADELRWMPRTRRLLAGQGLTFRNSFAPNPLCCPSRASFLTGRLSHNHQVLSHEDPYGFQAFDDSETLATRLQAAGYRTALVGKYLNGYGVQPTHDGAADSTLYVPPGWTEWYAGSDRIWPAGAGPGGNTYDYFHLTSNVNGEIRSWPGRYNTDVTAEQVRSLVTRFAQRPRAPWFLWWTPIAPHHGSPIEPDDPGVVPRPDLFPVTWVTPARPEWVKHRFDAEITGPPSARRVWQERDVSDKPGFLRRTPLFSPEEEEAVTAVARQRAEALYALDRQVAATLRALDASRQADRTIVVFTSDNGYYLGEHRKRQGKINLHEPSIRVPLLVRGPGVPRGDRFDPATTVDLAVTLAGYAGVRLARADGTDLRTTIADGDRGWDRPVLVEGRMPEERYAVAGDRSTSMTGLNTMGMRLGRWKLLLYATGETELYDLAADPLELESVARRRPEVLARLQGVWRDYVGCAGEECRRPLPRGLRLDAEENRDVTLRQEAETALP